MTALHDRTEHPDLQHVHTEEDVPNSAKAAPTRKGLINGLSLAAIALAALGLVLGFAVEASLGLVLTVVALVGGIVLTFMALGDQRAGAALPITATITGVISTLVLLLAAADVEPTDRLDVTPVAEIDEG